MNSTRPRDCRRTANLLCSAVMTLLLFVWLAPPLLAQSFMASLEGTVTDASAALVPGAHVVLTNEATGVVQTQQSNERGRYFFAAISPGVYELKVEVAGFRTFVRSQMQLQVQQQATVDVRLQPGDVTTRVEVTGEAPRLDTANATLGRVIDNVSVLNMPLGSRDTLELAMLTPGVIGSTGPTGSNFVSSGARNSQSDVLVDGITAAVAEVGGGNTDVRYRPSVETVREFKVQTNSFSAEYGFTGGTVVNMVLRSGTNRLHGSLFEFHRNSALNANDFFSNRAGRTLVPFRRNQFGGVAGGPVYIPRVYDGRNRTFFFFQYEATKQTSQVTSTQTVPTLLQKQGDFSQTFDAARRLITIYDPFAVTRDAAGNYSRTPFAGNVIPRARINPVAAATVKYYPDPTGPGVPNTAANNFFNSGSSASNAYQSTIKIDHNFSGRQRLSSWYSRTPLTQSAPNLWGNIMTPGDVKRVVNAPQSGSADYLLNLTPTTLLNLRWGVTRLNAPIDIYTETFDVKELGFQIPLNIQQPPSFTPESYSPVGTGRYNFQRRGLDTNQLVAQLSKVKGRHTIKFGLESRIQRINYASPGYNTCNFNFTRRATMKDPFRSNSLEGNAIASVMMGWGSGGGHYVDQAASWADQSHSFFFQDDLKLFSRLTLNLGLRYELPLIGTERYDRVNWVDLGVKSPISVPQFPNLRAGLVFANAKARAPYDTDSNNFAPRFGFAYQAMSKLVVRGGYGIYYGLNRAQMSYPLALGFTTSTAWTSSLDSDVTQYASLSNPFPAGQSRPQGSSQGLLSYVGLNAFGPIRDWNTVPYYQQWSFSIQRELPANSVAEVAYIGTRGVHLGFGLNVNLNLLDRSYLSLGTKLNDMVPNPFYGVITDPLSTLSQPTTTRMQLLRPYPQFTGFSGYPAPPIADSIYHAAQFKFTKRYSRSLAVSAHYTFSKMIDDNAVSSGNMQWLGGATRPQSPDRLWLERSVSIYDVTHRLVTDFAYELPVGRGRALGASWARWADFLLGGWQLNGILTFQSGTPLVPALSSGVLPDATQRPNLLSDPGLSGPVSERLNRYVDPNAFSRPAAYTLGTAPRTISSVRAPGLRNADVSLFKNLYFSREKGRYVQFRGEAFNVTNTPAFGAPDMTVGSATFGVISTQVNQPRQLQIALKLYF